VSRALGLGLLLLTACVAPLPHPTAQDALRARERWPEATVDSLEAGRHLFVYRCSGCHRLYAPRDRRADEWPDLLDDMAPHARISVEERGLIERFLVTASGSNAQLAHGAQ
jgi:hypothetical protein